jgi:hypothetical protein
MHESTLRVGGRPAHTAGVVQVGLFLVAAITIFGLRSGGPAVTLAPASHLSLLPGGEPC